jgi:hypothetical protein
MPALAAIEKSDLTPPKDTLYPYAFSRCQPGPALVIGNCGWVLTAMLPIFAHDLLPV